MTEEPRAGHDEGCSEVGVLGLRAHPIDEGHHGRVQEDLAVGGEDVVGLAGVGRHVRDDVVGLSLEPLRDPARLGGQAHPVCKGGELLVEGGVFRHHSRTEVPDDLGLALALGLLAEGHLSPVGHLQDAQNLGVREDVRLFGPAVAWRGGGVVGDGAGAEERGNEEADEGERGQASVHVTSPFDWFVAPRTMASSSRTRTGARTPSQGAPSDEAGAGSLRGGGDDDRD